MGRQADGGAGGANSSTHPCCPDGKSTLAPSASSSDIASTLLDAAAAWRAVKPLEFFASLSAPGSSGNKRERHQN